MSLDSDRLAVLALRVDAHEARLVAIEAQAAADRAETKATRAAIERQDELLAMLLTEHRKFRSEMAEKVDQIIAAVLGPTMVRGG
jgi:hypothetical protein